jgi:hypothetical protein
MPVEEAGADERAGCEDELGEQKQRGWSHGRSVAGVPADVKLAE